MAQDFKNDSLEVYSELHLDNQLCFSLYSLSRKVIQNYTPLLKPLDLTYPQYLVMLVMWQGLEDERKGLAVSQLTDKLKLDTGTVTPLLKRMEAKGLLSRQRSEKDERIVIVSLTTAGIDLREAAKHIPQALLCQADVDNKHLIKLRETLKAVLRVLP
ncbi:Transcriptional regulator, MarR family [Oleispira antarctica RB-8]|uniref:Transcriptional regulator, MarR family n=1 Tax=Oleispira antarctica RB-8 TaxID=698738 RepID=R4YN38_OLEAN|nr:Transcriptional regulator, MarR family [Oleispira antarctica RB-8]